MAYHDALFQLGMDLTRSSTAQKEDHGQSAPVARKPVSAPSPEIEDRKDHLVERNSVRFAGHHLIVDLNGASRLDDIGHIERTLARCVEVAGAKLLHTHLYCATPCGGVAGVSMLADGHISVHTRPEAGFAAFDVLMGGDAKPDRCLEILRKAFGTTDMVVRACRRGEAASTDIVEAMKPRKAQSRQPRQRTRERTAA